MHNIAHNSSNIYTQNIVFYHHPCIDGSVSAWAASLKLGCENTKYIGFGHNQKNYINTENILQQIPANSHVYFCDIVPAGEDVLNAILKKSCLVSIYDHHISAKRHLEQFKKDGCEIIFDMERSGAGLSWDIFNAGKKRPFVVDLVEAMDLYKVNHFETTDEFFTFAAGVDTLELDDFDKFRNNFSNIANKEDGGREIIYSLGQKKRSLYLEKIENALSRIKYVEIEGVKLAFVWDDIHKLSREFWHKFEEFCKFDGKTLAICHFENKGALVSISLRSDGNIDVSKFAEKIAQKYGLNGGGHKKAAAVRFTKEQFDGVLEKWQLPTN